MFSLIAAILAGVLGIAGLGISASQTAQNEQAQKDANATNLKMNEETNETNLAIARETNAANVNQANLSYQRSLPVNQVRNMMQAGASQSAAINTLTGGGTYTAPVLSAGQVQAGHVNPVMKDFSKITESLDRLNNIPGNVQQSQMMQQQLNDAKQLSALRMAEETRKQELHQFDMWQKMYGKNAATMIDDLSSQIVSMAADKGISLDGIDSTDKLVKAFDLASNKTWRNMPAAARNQVLDGVRIQAAENRAQAEETRRQRAADDAHRLSLLAEKMQQVDVKYADRNAYAKLINIMRNNENLLQDGKIKFQDARSKEFDNYVREAGIDDEAEARRIGQLALRLANDDELAIQLQRKADNDATFGLWNQFRILLRDLGELFMHVKLQ